MNSQPKNPGSDISIDTCCHDKLYPRVTRAVEKLLARGKVVAPADVLVAMGLLNPKDLEAWHRGRIPYLEKAINCNLTRLSRLLRILRFHAHDLNLVPSVAAYMRRGKGPAQRLRFTMSGDPKLEEAYARGFVWPGQGPFHPFLESDSKTRECGLKIKMTPVPPPPKTRAAALCAISKPPRLTKSSPHTRARRP